MDASFKFLLLNLIIPAVYYTTFAEDSGKFNLSLLKNMFLGTVYTSFSINFNLTKTI